MLQKKNWRLMFVENLLRSHIILISPSFKYVFFLLSQHARCNKHLKQLTVQYFKQNASSWRKYTWIADWFVSQFHKNGFKRSLDMVVRPPIIFYMFRCLYYMNTDNTTNKLCIFSNLLPQKSLPLSVEKKNRLCFAQIAQYPYGCKKFAT